MPLLSRADEVGLLIIPVLVQLLCWSRSTADPADINPIISGHSSTTRDQLEGRGGGGGGGGLTGHTEWHAMMLCIGNSKEVTDQARSKPEPGCAKQLH